MTLTYDLTTSLGQLRLAIGDHRIDVDNGGIQPDGAHFTDEELQAFVTMAGSWQLAAPYVLRATAAIYSAMAQSVSFDGYSESFAGTADALFKAAAAWDTANAGSGVTVDAMADTFSSYAADYLFTTDRFPPL